MIAFIFFWIVTFCVFLMWPGTPVVQRVIAPLILLLVHSLALFSTDSQYKRSNVSARLNAWHSRIFPIACSLGILIGIALLILSLWEDDNDSRRRLGLLMTGGYGIGLVGMKITNVIRTGFKNVWPL